MIEGQICVFTFVMVCPCEEVRVCLGAPEHNQFSKEILETVSKNEIFFQLR